jgi:hypothetical protein
MTTLKKQARIAGLWYLLLGITGAFALMYVPSQIIVAGDTATTISNIREQELLYRFGIVGHLACQANFIFLALALYDLFKNVHKAHARLLVAFVVASVPISFVNELNHIGPLVLLSGADFLNAFRPEQLHTLSMGMLELYDYGIHIVEVFWGLWLLPFGLLAYRSGFIPKIFGVLLIVACFVYLLQSFGTILWPATKEVLATVSSITGTVGEVSILLWLLIQGAREQYN